MKFIKHIQNVEEMGATDITVLFTVLNNFVNFRKKNLMSL
jgi:hypothetical protein